LVRTFDDPVPVPSGGKSRHIPVIIDYGYATIKIDGMDLPSMTEPVSSYIGENYLDVKVASIDMYHLLLKLARRDGLSSGPSHDVISQMFSDLGYGSMAQILSQPIPVRRDRMPKGDWL